MYKHRIANQPIPIEWDGWISDTMALYRQGWEIQMDQMEQFMEARIAIRNPRSGIVGFGYIDYNRYIRDLEFERLVRDYGEDKYRGARPVRLDLFSKETQVMQYPGPRHHEAKGYFEDMEAYQPVDCIPKPASIEELGHKIFMPLGNDNSQIIVPEESVSDLLSRIKEMQKESQADIRERMRKRDRREIFIPSPQLQAQILSFKRA